MPRWSLVALLAAPGLAAAQPPTPPAGQKLVVTGHSFHIPTIGPLNEIAAAAGVTDHKVVATQPLGGSRVIQVWNMPDDKARKALRAGGVDVLTVSPHFELPDDGIDKFADVLVEHNPRGRILVQASWLAWDRTDRMAGNFQNADRDKADPAALRKLSESYRVPLTEQLSAINKRHREKAGRDVAFVVPVGAAVIALREKVVAGQADGVARQSDLFKDPIGHAKEPVLVLAGYCWYAAIYGRSPVGLPVPPTLKKAGGSEKLNRLLQELAWDAVSTEPLSGVSPAAPK